jgi:hypothetical protein
MVRHFVLGPLHPELLGPPGIGVFLHGGATVCPVWSG